MGHAPCGYDTKEEAESACTNDPDCMAVSNSSGIKGASSKWYLWKGSTEANTTLNSTPSITCYKRTACNEQVPVNSPLGGAPSSISVVTIYSNVINGVPQMKMFQPEGTPCDYNNLAYLWSLRWTAPGPDGTWVTPTIARTLNVTQGGMGAKGYVTTVGPGPEQSSTCDGGSQASVSFTVNVTSGIFRAGYPISVGYAGKVPLNIGSPAVVVKGCAGFVYKSNLEKCISSIPQVKKALTNFT